MRSGTDSIEAMKVRKQAVLSHEASAISTAALALKFGFGLALVAMLVVSLIVNLFPVESLWKDVFRLPHFEHQQLFGFLSFEELVQLVVGVVGGAAAFLFRISK